MAALDPAKSRQQCCHSCDIETEALSPLCLCLEDVTSRRLVRHSVKESVTLLQEEEAAESAAQEAVSTDLQRRATSRAAWLSATRRSALDWLRSPVTEAAIEAVAEWQRTLQVRFPSNLCSMSAFLAR